MALAYSGVQVELREVKLSDLPDAMLQISPKATVPVLLLPDGRVIDESLDVMEWSLAQEDSDRWLDITRDSRRLVQRCDNEFKPLLDHYKYSDRHPQQSPLQHRREAEIFVRELNERLGTTPCLDGDQWRLPDMAIFPFIRQFAGVDNRWFEKCEYTAVRHWLNRILDSSLFQQVMTKNPLWSASDDPVYLTGGK